MPKDERESINTQEQEAEGFSEAFEAAVTASEELPPEEKEAPPEEPPKETLPAEEPPKEQPPKEETPQGEPPKPPAKKEDEETYQQRYSTLQGIHKHDKEAWEREKQELLAKVEAKPAEKRDEEKPPEQESPGLTDEQKEEMSLYERDFDLISRMEGLKRQSVVASLRKEFREAMEAIKAEVTGRVSEVETTLTEKVSPAVALAADRTAQIHYETITNGYKRDDGTTIPGHPDWQELVSDGSLLKWIESKPAYARPSYMQVYEKGVAEEVIDLISDYKREVGGARPDTLNPRNARREAKKQAMTVVSDRRGAVQTNVAHAEDFESSFDEAVNQLGG